MLSKEIRKKFLQYFQKHKHTIVPSSPVLPSDDATLLFVNAGMNQFKDVFLGKSKRDYVRAVTSQKCIRVGGKHNDLENVGHTTRHNTFFEMLGNFSFGDYFKEKAIQYAWEVTTTIFGFEPEFLWASVFEKDEESFALWQKYLPVTRIVRMGEKENFWSMGEMGPCGPCSELLYDRGSKYSSAKSPLEDSNGERYLEFWNLVFMEFDRQDGKLNPLPQKSVDTGAGLERIVSLKLGVKTVFETDILRALISEIELISHQKYVENTIQSPAFHVIADHIRSLAFAIADGVQPSNIERGYVLRKILRRAVRYGRTLGLLEPFLSKLIPKLIILMGEEFPELKLSQNRIEETLEIEEISFLRTLEKGENIFQQILEKSENIISGEDAFKLKDTFGFPIEEILLIAKDSNKSIDLKTFEILEKKAKERSRLSQKGKKERFEQSVYKETASHLKENLFVGYDKYECSANILAIVSEDKLCESLLEGQAGVLILDQTPFYAEMGGQLADKGVITSSQFTFQVTNCLSPFPGIIAHIGFVEKGEVTSQSCSAQIDIERRKNIACNHSATHLLNFALKKVLGEHIKQAGSLVEDTRLRFDFPHHKALSKKEIRQLEMLINEKIRENFEVKSYEVPYSEVQRRSDILQVFGEKYKDVVRVIDMDFSKELCGGTHVKRLGDIGFVKISKEIGIAAGIRRIEACSASYAEKYVYQKEDLIESIAQTLKTSDLKVLERLDLFLSENQSLEKEIKEYRKLEIKRQVVVALSQVEKVKGIPFIALETTLDMKQLQAFADEIMQELKSGVLAIAIKAKERCQFLIKVSPDFVDKKIHADDLIQKIAPIIQGGGGGKKNQAQAGGKDPSQIPQALSKVRQFLEEL